LSQKSWAKMVQKGWARGHELLSLKFYAVVAAFPLSQVKAPSLFAGGLFNSFEFTGVHQINN